MTDSAEDANPTAHGSGVSAPLEAAAIDDTPRQAEHGGRFPLFNGMRALAATLVFIFHWYRLPNIDFGIAMSHLGVGVVDSVNQVVAHLGQVGVALFYLISGFLLYRPFARARLLGSERPNLGGYAIRRATRIIPAYWAALIVIALLPVVNGSISPLLDQMQGTLSPGGILDWFLFGSIYQSNAWTSYHPYIPSWTIAVEVSFYIFLPFWAWLMSVLAKRTGRALMVDAWGLSLLFAIGVIWKIVAAPSLNTVTEALPARAFVVLPASLDVFAVGMAFAVLSLRPEALSPARALRALADRPGLCWALAALFFGLIAVFGDPKGVFSPGIQFRELSAAWLKIPAAALLLLPAVFGDQSKGLIRRALGSGPVFWIGMVSHGLFIWQIWVLRNLTDPSVVGSTLALDRIGIAWLPLAMAVGYAATLAIAALSWYLVEKRFISLGRRWSARD